MGYDHPWVSGYEYLWLDGWDEPFSVWLDG